MRDERRTALIKPKLITPRLINVNVQQNRIISMVESLYLFKSHRENLAFRPDVQFHPERSNNDPGQSYPHRTIDFSGAQLKSGRFHWREERTRPR